jgi:hypothetical protein
MSFSRANVALAVLVCGIVVPSVAVDTADIEVVRQTIIKAAKTNFKFNVCCNYIFFVY